MLSRQIGIDLGTCNSLVFVPKKGIVLQEPSVVAVALDENKILAVGKEAQEMAGRTPDTISVYRPLKEGVIADFRITQAMLSYFIEKVMGKLRFFKPELLISVPGGITSTERRAVIEAALKAGAKEAFAVKEPILAALGAGIPIGSYSGNLIVNIGGGTTEVAVISLGGIVVSNSVRVAGDKIDAAIANYIKKKYNLAIGERTAEEIKIKIGTALPEKEPRYLEIKGRDLLLGLPKDLKISSNEISPVISEVLTDIVQAIKQVLRSTPPELAADIMEKGMIISGGGALLRRIDELISKEIGIPAFIAEDPLLCVAKGTGVILENFEAYKRTVISKR